MTVLLVAFHVIFFYDSMNCGDGPDFAFGKTELQTKGFG